MWTSREGQRSPPPPFIISPMQGEAGKRRFSADLEGEPPSKRRNTSFLQDESSTQLQNQSTSVESSSLPRQEHPEQFTDISSSGLGQSFTSPPPGLELWKSPTFSSGPRDLPEYSNEDPRDLSHEKHKTSKTPVGSDSGDPPSDDIRFCICGNHSSTMTTGEGKKYGHSSGARNTSLFTSGASGHSRYKNPRPRDASLWSRDCGSRKYWNPAFGTCINSKTARAHFLMQTPALGLWAPLDKERKSCTNASAGPETVGERDIGAGPTATTKPAARETPTSSLVADSRPMTSARTKHNKTGSLRKTVNLGNRLHGFCPTSLWKATNSAAAASAIPTVTQRLTNTTTFEGVSTSPESHPSPSVEAAPSEGDTATAAADEQAAFIPTLRTGPLTLFERPWNFSNTSVQTELKTFPADDTTARPPTQYPVPMEKDAVDTAAPNSGSNCMATPGRITSVSLPQRMVYHPLGTEKTALHSTPQAVQGRDAATGPLHAVTSIASGSAIMSSLPWVVTSTADSGKTVTSSIPQAVTDVASREAIVTYFLQAMASTAPPGKPVATSISQTMMNDAATKGGTTSTLPRTTPDITATTSVAMTSIPCLMTSMTARGNTFPTAIPQAVTCVATSNQGTTSFPQVMMSFASRETAVSSSIQNAMTSIATFDSTAATSAQQTTAGSVASNVCFKTPDPQALPDFGARGTATRSLIQDGAARVAAYDFTAATAQQTTVSNASSKACFPAFVPQTVQSHADGDRAATASMPQAISGNAATGSTIPSPVPHGQLNAFAAVGTTAANFLVRPTMIAVGTTAANFSVRPTFAAVGTTAANFPVRPTFAAVGTTAANFSVNPTMTAVGTTAANFSVNPTMTAVGTMSTPSMQQSRSGISSASVSSGVEWSTAAPKKLGMASVLQSPSITASGSAKDAVTATSCRNDQQMTKTTPDESLKQKLPQQALLTKWLIPHYLDHLIQVNTKTVGQLDSKTARPNIWSLQAEAASAVRNITSNTFPPDNTSSSDDDPTFTIGDTPPAMTSFQTVGYFPSNCTLSVYDFHCPGSKGACQSFAQDLQSNWSFPTTRFLTWAEGLDQHAWGRQRLQGTDLGSLASVPRPQFPHSRDLDRYIFYRCQEKLEALGSKLEGSASKD